MNPLVPFRIRHVIPLSLIFATSAGITGCVDKADVAGSRELADRYVEEWLTVTREPTFVEWFSPKLRVVLLAVRNACDTSASTVRHHAENVTNQFPQPSTVGHIYSVKKDCAEWMLRLDFIPRDGEDDLVRVRVEQVKR
jgi:hypothetical protein